MDHLTFADGYTDYSDSSTPRTPSPQEYHAHYNPKDMLFTNDEYRPGLLQELYEQDSPYSPDWHAHQQPIQPQPHSRPADYTMVRRATFPYVRQDANLPPPFIAPQTYYAYEDPNIKLEEQPNQPFYRHPVQAYQHPHEMHPHLQHQFNTPMPAPPYISPHTGLPVQHTDDAASKETQYLRRRCFNCHTTEPPSWRRSTLNPGKIVCNKCGLYERTHLRPRPLRFDELRAGNKARKGSKGQLNVGHQVGGPNVLSSPPLGSPKIKKEPGVGGSVHRRSSVSSNASTQNGGSDWDDSVSIYSTSSNQSSAPPTSFSSPAHGSFPLPLRDSLSPPVTSAGPLSNEIRLPNNPLAELHHQRSHPNLMLQQQQQQPQQSPSPHLHPQSPPRKSHSMPIPRSDGPLLNSYPPSGPMPSMSELPEWSQPTASPPHMTGSPLHHASPQALE